MALNFMIVATDGTGMIRVLGAQAMQAGDRDRIREIVLRTWGDGSAPAPAEPPPPPPKPLPPAAASTMTQGEIARLQGFSGNVCAQCGSFNMKRAGTCETCQDCGNTSGCG